MEQRFKEYIGTDFKVLYSPKLCIHAAECVRGLPDVFQPQAKPWIQLENAEVQELARVIAQCPSGALQLESGAAPETAPNPPVFTLLENGPIYVRGEYTFPNTEIRTTRLALCRCGQSNNKPFCDNQHQQGFQAYACQLEPTKLLSSSNTQP
jgi:uncharacterized Fe-S cluster protein YjdI/CDGSH-type Zn-finger protein